MILTGEASFGGGLGSVLRIGANGSAQWRGQTIEADAWTRMQEYDHQHGVTDLWSRAQEASRRYSTSTGDSELASLEESLGANLTRMQRFEDRAALSYGESEQWSEQAAAVRSPMPSRSSASLASPSSPGLPGGKAPTAGRSGRAGPCGLASPQTAEDAEALREHAAAFIAERFPAPPGPDPASVAGRPAFEEARSGFEATHGPATMAAHAGWAGGSPRSRRVCRGARPRRDRLQGRSRSRRRRGGARCHAGRAANTRVQHRAPRRLAEGRDGGRGRERSVRSREHAAEEVPFIGGWLAGKLYGTAQEQRPGRIRATAAGRSGGTPGRSRVGRAVRGALVGVPGPVGKARVDQPPVVVRAGAGGHVARVVVHAGRLILLPKPRPVATAEAPPERMRDRGQDGPGESGEPDRREELLPRPERRPDPRRYGRDSNSAEHKRAFPPCGASARRVPLCRYFVHNRAVYGCRPALEAPAVVASGNAPSDPGLPTPFLEGDSPC